jgi:glycosyltransferase involved in cell wall biosynthesis
VEFLGFLNDYEDVLGHMRAADIFASPSIREGFGVTFVEAMAADCTVIAADHPDSAADEVIDDARASSSIPRSNP